MKKIVHASRGEIVGLASEAAQLQQLKCHRCGHTWYPRSPKRPAHCAKCNSPYWASPRKTGAGLAG